MLLFSVAGNSWFTHLRQLGPSKIGCKSKYFVDCCSNFFRERALQSVQIYK